MSSKASILVNGNLTYEFSLYCGLNRDPLFIFLFIMVMEGLHVAIEDTICTGLIQPIIAGSFGLGVLIFYVDDVLF